jgi:hypothetical protein
MAAIAERGGRVCRRGLVQAFRDNGSATYYKPLAARAIESVVAVLVGEVAGGALNQFKGNARKTNV